MKISKRFASVIIALVMMMTMMLPAMAANITVKNAVNGESYTAYKIFDVTNSGDSYAYSIAADSVWFSLVENYKVDGNSVFKLTQSGDKYVVEVNEVEVEGSKVSLFAEESDAADFAKYLEEAGIPTGATVADEVTAAEGTAVLDNLDAGYYFVDTTLGSLCALHTSVSEQEVFEKNELPVLDKSIINKDDVAVNEDDVSIGDTVNFQLTVTDGKGTDGAITVHDKMDEGLTLNNDSFAIQVGGVDVGEANYTLTTTGLADDCDFEIVFNADFIKSLDETDEIIITYSAVLNENAKIYEETNNNTAWIDYSNQEKITPDTVVVKTYEFAVVKVDDEDNILNGAEFKLYDAITDGNEIAVVKTGDHSYRKAVDGETGVAIEASYATIEGLDAGTYYLEETVAPTGYNKLATRVEVVIGEDHTVTLSFADGTGELDLESSNNFEKVINKTGSILPSTGGIGTTIFYCVGGILVVVALVLIITKKRMSHES